jgi:hypothetical protein
MVIQGDLEGTRAHAAHDQPLGPQGRDDPRVVGDAAASGPQWIIPICLPGVWIVNELALTAVTVPSTESASTAWPGAAAAVDAGTMAAAEPTTDAQANAPKVRKRRITDSFL